MSNSKDPKGPKKPLSTENATERDVINAVHACASILQSAAYVLRMIPDETEFAPGFQEELKLCEDFLRRASIFVYATGVESTEPNRDEVLDVAMETIEHHYDYLTSKREGVLSIKSSYSQQNSKADAAKEPMDSKSSELNKTLGLNGGLFGNLPKGEA